MINRQVYLEKITGFLGKHIIKVLVGQRRVGKTTLLKQIENLVGHEKCLFLSLDDLSLRIDTVETLKEYLDIHITRSTTTLLIDEIQLVLGWERVINHFYSTVPSLDIIITGSNSAMFSGELATLLSGRYIKIHVFGFSYGEFLAYKKLKKGRESFEQYLEYGTTPSLYQFEDTDVKKQRCESLIDTIIVKDISLKRKIRDIGLLKTVILYVINNIANLTNIATIVESLSHQGYTTSIETVGVYIEYLKAVFLFYEVERYDLQGKTILQRQRKFYLNDPTMRALLFGGYDIGLTKTLENIVYLEMRVAGWSVAVGTMKNKEVDFICEKGGATVYIQVTYALLNEEIIEREYTSLELITDNRPKYVVSLDSGPFQARNGIIHVPVREIKKIAGGE